MSSTFKSKQAAGRSVKDPDIETWSSAGTTTKPGTKRRVHVQLQPMRSRTGWFDVSAPEVGDDRIANLGRGRSASHIGRPHCAPETCLD